MLYEQVCQCLVYLKPIQGAHLLPRFCQLPYCVFIEIREALNASPIFVYDDTAQFTVQRPNEGNRELMVRLRAVTRRICGNNPIFMGP